MNLRMVFSSRALVLALMFCFGVAPVQANVKKGLKVMVSLSPAGSFEVVGNKFKGGSIVKKEVGLTLDKMIVPADSLKTGVDLRDEHLHKRLKGDVVIDSGTAVGGKGKAFITLAGVRKQVEFTYDHSDAKMIRVQLHLSLREFAITDINYMGVGVKDDVTIEAILPVK